MLLDRRGGLAHRTWCGTLHPRSGFGRLCGFDFRDQREEVPVGVGGPHETEVRPRRPATLDPFGKRQVAAIGAPQAGGEAVQADEADNDQAEPAEPRDGVARGDRRAPPHETPRLVGHIGDEGGKQGHHRRLIAPISRPTPAAIATARSGFSTT